MKHRILLSAVALVALLSLPSCAQDKAEPQEAADPSLEASATAATTDEAAIEEAPLENVISQADIAGLLGKECVFDEASLQETDAGLEAVATAQLAEGEKVAENGVLAVLSALAAEYADVPYVRLDLWTPGTPDARFAQYLWDRGLSRLERFEASVPAEEFGFYAPVGTESGGANPQGFDANRTGVIENVDADRLGALAKGGLSWESDTP